MGTGSGVIEDRVIDDSVDADVLDHRPADGVLLCLMTLTHVGKLLIITFCHRSFLSSPQWYLGAGGLHT
jgi:hypothetical protein